MASEEQVQRRGRMLMALTVLALLAVADGAYLTYVHAGLAVGKPGAAQVCHAFSRDGCAVTAGQYGDVAGVAVSVIGMAGAMATFVVGLVAWSRRREDHEPWRAAAFVLAALSVLASIVMGALSASEGSYCPFCVAWYGLNLGMGACGWLALQAHERRPAELLRQATGAPLLAMVAAFSLTLAAGTYGDGLHTASLLEERDAFLRGQIEEILAGGQTEIPMDHLPTSGPDDAEVTIVEVADFECPFCKRLWDSVQAYKASSGRTVRTAFIHYPLDGKCNPRVDGAHQFACGSALAAECARREDKFFEYGALMFEHQPRLAHEDLLEYARQLGLDMDAFERCLEDPETGAAVTRSIATAIRLDVQATPTFYVNGYKFEGARPPAMLEAIVETLLSAER